MTTTMAVISALIIFIIGGILGFIANHFLSNSNQKHRKLADQVSKSEASLALYKLDVANHLESSTLLLNQMNTTCQIAMKQMEESTQLLQRAGTTNTQEMPFFSQETQEQLAQTVDLRNKTRTDEMATEPALDYSGSASGLFADQKSSSVNAG